MVSDTILKLKTMHSGSNINVLLRCLGLRLSCGDFKVGRCHLGSKIQGKLIWDKIERLSYFLRIHNNC